MKRFKSISPIDESLIWSGRESDWNHVNQVVLAARAAFPAWARRPAHEREDLCLTFRDLLKRDAEKMAELIYRETGKPLWESRTEVASMIGKVDLSIAAQKERAGELEKQTASGTAQLSHRPHGVVAVFGPYNFPGHLPNGHIVPALLAGNTVIFKPSEQTPAVGELMIQLWREAGVPDGIISLVQGGRDTGIALAGHAGLDGLFFTGSSVVGEALHRQFAGKTSKILALEMGGNNPLVVCNPESIEAAVYATIQSAFISAGQRCTCARRLIVVNDKDGRKFLTALAKATRKLLVSPTNPQAFCGPLISRQAADQLLAAQDGLLGMGGEAIVPMQRLPDCPAALTPGIIDVTAVVSLADTEYFGPLLQVIRVPDFETAIAVANRTRFGLAAGLLSRDPNLWQEFHLRARAGVVNWNKPLTGASGAAPFGGIGASGNHRPSAWYAADYCAYPVASLVAENLELPETLLPGVTL